MRAPSLSRAQHESTFDYGPDPRPSDSRSPGSGLQVTLSGLQHDRGRGRGGVCRCQSFRKDDQAFAAQKAKAEAGTVTVTFDDVPPGRYAVLAYHDENDNGRLDLRFGMIPVEGYGLSNNPKVMGPPSYEDSAFEVTANEPARIELKMRY